MCKLGLPFPLKNATPYLEGEQKQKPQAQY